VEPHRVPLPPLPATSPYSPCHLSLFSLPLSGQPAILAGMIRNEKATATAPSAATRATPAPPAPSRTPQTPAPPGPIRGDELYLAADFRRRVRWGRKAWTRARKAGLPVLTFGREQYVIGNLALAWFAELQRQQGG